MSKIAFIGETFPHRSLNVSGQRSLNLYPEIIKNSEGKSNYILVGTAGSEIYADLSSVTSANCRGLHYTSNGQLYGVYGDKLIRVSSTGTIEASFDLSGGSSAVSLTDNGTYLAFVDGAILWLLNIDTDTLDSQALPSGLTSPQMIKYLGRRFVTFGEDSNQFWWSAIDDPTTWEGSAVASAEGSADIINSMATTDGELVIFGPRSYEVYRVTADPDLPFGRVGGAFTNIGCGAPNSVAEIMGSVFWLGSSTAGKNQVFMMQGYNAVPISNHAISSILEGLDRSAPNDLINTTSDCVGFTYQQNNHIFYVMNFIQANKTIVYDVNGQWHERSTRSALYNVENRWEPLYCVYAHDRIICGNGRVPYMVELRLDKYDEYDGRLIKRQRVSPIYYDDMGYLFYHDFIVDMESGVGLTDSTAQGYDPQAMIRWSDDSGHTWSNERWVPIGKVGKYNTRVRLNKLGRAYNRVFELTITDPVKVVLLGASAKVSKGRKR
jgi:hypothetical protein